MSNDVSGDKPGDSAERLDAADIIRRYGEYRYKLFREEYEKDYGIEK